MRKCGWTGQIIYLEMSASAREDLSEGAQCIAWDEVEASSEVSATVGMTGTDDSSRA